MNIVIEKINYKEALRYLGAGGKEISPEMNALLEVAEKELLSCAAPKITYKQDEKEIVFAATLGNAVDRLIQKKQVNDMASAVMIDGLASEMIEQVLDEFEAIIKSGLKEKASVGGDGFVLGPRFSPGYGDFPLEAQKDIIRHLDAEKAIGLTLTSGGMLSPVKSVTGIMRIFSETDFKKNPEKLSLDLDKCNGCDRCSMKDACKFRKN